MNVNEINQNWISVEFTKHSPLRAVNIATNVYRVYLYLYNKQYVKWINRPWIIMQQ